MSWQDELQQLDTAHASGEISADEYRRRRDQVLASAAGGQQAAAAQPPGGVGTVDVATTVWMTVWIDVVGDNQDAAKGHQLLDWLRSEPKLWRAVVMREPRPEPGELRPAAATLMATLSSAATITAFASVITAFLNQRRDIKIRITSAGRTVELTSGSKASDVEAFVQAGSVSGVNNVVSGSLSGPVIQAGDIYGGMRLRVPSVAVDDDPPRPAPERAESSMLPVTIYLSDEGSHERVEAAVEQVLAAVGLRIESRDDPILGSWFRRMWATAAAKLRTPSGREAVLVAAHAAETRLVLAPDADVTAKLLQSVGPVITSLESTENAVVRLGNVLIVKADGVVAVSQLTPAQQFLLNHQPELACSPHKILAALKDTAIEGGDCPPALQ
jgi:hypothetical protein